MENNTTWEETFEGLGIIGAMKMAEDFNQAQYNLMLRSFGHILPDLLTAARAEARAEAISTKVGHPRKGNSYTDGYHLGRAEALKEAIAVVESKKDWPEPVEGAGEQIGPLAGVGMYMQYDADRKKHREELSEIIRQLTALQ